MRRSLLLGLAFLGAVAGCPDANPPVAPTLPPPGPEARVQPVAPPSVSEGTVDASAWEGLGPGSVLELETAGTRTRVRHTVLARDARTVLVRTETTVNGVALTAAVGTHSLGERPVLEDAEELGRESVETTAGRFDCRKLRGVDGLAWEAAGLPVFVKVVGSVGGASSSTTVLVRVERR